MSSNTLSSIPIFTPTQISGCTLWLDGADPNGNGRVPANGSSVATWVDKSGSGNNATGGTSPSYTVNRGVTFNGTSQYLTLPSASLPSGNSAFSFFYVVSASASTGGAGIILGGYNATPPTRNANTYLEAGNKWSYYDWVSAVQITTSTTVVLNTTYILNYIYTQNANIVLNLNGTQENSAVASSLNNPNNIVYLGANPYYSNYWFPGTMSEILVYNTAVSTAQRQQVEGYLAWKWGLQGSLPSNHPYRNTPIYATTTLPPQFRSIGAVPLAPSSSLFSFFNPASVPGCQLWLDAADQSSFALSGSNITTWNDKSGNGRNTTNLFGTPTRSGSNVVFAGAQLMGTSLSYSGLNANSFFSVCETTSAAMNGNVIGVRTNTINGGYQIDVYALVPKITTYGGYTAVTGSTNFTTNTKFVYNGTYSGTSTAYLYLNGSQIGSGPGQNIGSGTVTIGGHTDLGASSLGEPWVGNINEIIIYNYVLSTTQRQQVEGYLAWKWSLQNNLPSNHPFKNSPPGLPVPSIPPRLTMNTRVFTPLSIGGCQLWLDAADTSTLALSGTNVSQWNDKSPNGYNLNQVTEGNRPTRANETSGVSFTGNLYLQQTSGNVPNIRDATAITIVSVVQSIVNVPYNNVITFYYKDAAVGLATTPKFNLYTSYNSAYKPYFQVSTTSGQVFVENPSALTVNTKTIVGCSASPTAITANFNGTIATSGGQTLRTASSDCLITLGYPGYQSVGIFEVVLYNYELTTNQRQSIEGYLAWKYSLQGSLPSTHPYKKWPPPPS
jgi:hypothetical protein